MPERNEGLCSTCKHSSRCTLTRAPAQDIHFCEEYETGDGSFIGRKTRSGAKAGQYGRPDAKTHALNQVLGLCGNCVHYQTCRFPHPESGVWHCEEYE